VKTWFQAFACKCNLYHYSEAEALVPGAQCTALAWCRPTGAAAVGMMTMASGAPAGSDAAPPPPMVAIGLTWPGKGGESDARVLAYDEAGMRWRVVVGLYKLNPAVTLSLKAPGFNP
jgi:hypothetical protein